MRFERVSLPAFGTLEEVDTGHHELGPLVVVQGPNESGKSTFFEALTTVLYGFRPASRERHPYAPWNGADAEIEARLRTDSGSVLEVNRRLLQAATGRATFESEERTLRNRPLPAVEGIPRELYRQVFALTLDELSALDSESWEKLQERLLSRMGATDIVAARSAAEVLDDEAGRLWRPNRRGSQRIRELKQRIHERLRSRREVAEDDRRLRGLHRDRAKIGDELRALRDRRERTRLIVERATVLLPLKRRLERIRALEQRADDGPPLDALPDSPRARVSELRREVEALDGSLEQLATETKEAETALARLTPSFKAALAARTEIVEAVAAATRTESAQIRNAQLEQEINDLDRRIAAAAREVFRSALDEEAIAVLEELPVVELGSRVDRWQEAKRNEELHALEDRLERPRHHTELLAGLATLAVGIVLLAAIPTLPGRLGGLVLTGIGTLLLTRWWRLSSATPAREAPEEMENDVGVAVETRVLVTELLSGLPLRDREPDRELVAQLTRLQELYADRRARAAALDEGARQMMGAVAAVGELGRRIGLELPIHAGSAGHQLERHLTAAERADEAAGAANRDLHRIRTKEREASSRRTTSAEELHELERLLAVHGDGGWVAGLERIEAREQAAAEARAMWADLEREHADLDHAMTRISDAAARGERWVEDDQELIAARRTLEELTTRIERMAAEEEGLNREIRHLEKSITTDQIDGEVAALNLELDQLRMERDRKVVLAALLRRADRDFREKHEPDVLTRAAEHLGAITRGRYSELLAPEGDVSTSIGVRDPDSGRPVLVQQLSKGTREQVYFSLRLAVMDHLDARGERLPVLVDEAFVHWDPTRRERLLDVLARLEETRQVFVFTCHPEWAEALSTHGGHVITLGGDVT